MHHKIGSQYTVNPLHTKQKGMRVMKKSLALGAVGLMCAGGAMAQSSVVVYGVLDTYMAYTNAEGTGNVFSVDSGGYQASRLGFRGTEDLGGGMRINWQLENGFGSDTGAQHDTSRLFNRQAWVGLGGKFGQVSIGRQYTPLFLALNSIDPFGAISTAGTSANLFSLGGIRMNNTVKYAYGGPAGFSVDLSYAPGEQAGSSSSGRVYGALAGYGAGPFAVRLAHHRANSVATAALPSSAGKTTLLGATWDLRVVKLAAALASNKGAVAIAGQQQVDTRDYLLGATIPVGAGKILASTLRKDDRSGRGRDADQWGVAYVHALSKRTALYTAYGTIDNAAAAGQPGFYTVGNASDLGSGDTAFNLGMRHSF